MTAPGAADGVFRREDAERIRQFQEVLAQRSGIGAEVVVTVTGTVERRGMVTGSLHVRTIAGALVTLPADGDVHVVELEPERPTLEWMLVTHQRRETTVLAPDAMRAYDACSCGWRENDPDNPPGSPTLWEHHAAAELRAAGLAR